MAAHAAVRHDGDRAPGERGGPADPPSPGPRRDRARAAGTPAADLPGVQVAWDYRKAWLSGILPAAAPSAALHGHGVADPAGPAAPRRPALGVHADHPGRRDPHPGPLSGVRLLAGDAGVDEPVVLNVQVSEVGEVLNLHDEVGQRRRERRHGHADPRHGAGVRAAPDRAPAAVAADRGRAEVVPVVPRRVGHVDHGHRAGGGGVVQVPAGVHDDAVAARRGDRHRGQAVVGGVPTTDLLDDGRRGQGGSPASGGMGEPAESGERGQPTLRPGVMSPVRAPAFLVP